MVTTSSAPTRQTVSLAAAQGRQDIPANTAPACFSISNDRGGMRGAGSNRTISNQSADRADCLAVRERRYRLPATGDRFVALPPGSEAIKPNARSGNWKSGAAARSDAGVFTDDAHRTRGRYDDGHGGHCLVGALLHLSREHRLPPAPAIALLQDAMPRPGLPLVHFNDDRCGIVAELRSVILKARRLAHDIAERERADAAVKAWLLAQIEEKRAATAAANIAKSAPEGPPACDRLATACRRRIDEKKNQPVSPPSSAYLTTSNPIRLYDAAPRPLSAPGLVFPSPSFRAPATTSWFAGGRRRLCVLASPGCRVPAPGCA